MRADDPGDLDAAYERTAGLLGDFASTIEVGPSPLRGDVMTDPAWLAGRVADTGARWGCTDARVNGTLWWYAATSTLVVAPLTMLLYGGRAPDPGLRGLRIALRDNGYLAAVRSGPWVGSVGEYSAALRDAHGEVIDVLADVSGASPRALWAIATDSLANRALDAGYRLGRVDEACALAGEIAAPPLLAPRYVDVDGPSRPRRYVRRSSCCLIYSATGGETCVSCPRRRPDDRLSRLARHAADLERS